jgi:DNA modification methylase
MLLAMRVQTCRCPVEQEAAYGRRGTDQVSYHRRKQSDKSRARAAYASSGVLNNVELGKRGRWRSNVWTYPGASSLGSDARRGLKDHPTVKPTAMLEDALLDLSNRSDIVVDPFLGSGSTLIAADKTSRVCRGVELDPLYVDVIVRRYEAATGNPAVLIETGEAFDLLAEHRSRDAAPV